MRKGASKLDIPPLSNSVLISTDPKTSILLSNKIKQLIHIKSKQKLLEWRKDERQGRVSARWKQQRLRYTPAAKRAITHREKY